ncbi:hypothetical protein SOVF_013650 [Spinacia oleracea]|nr:hypothetical protein SOVF_013650 [Spinacia oleracea]
MSNSSPLYQRKRSKYEDDGRWEGSYSSPWDLAAPSPVPIRASATSVRSSRRTREVCHRLEIC